MNRAFVREADGDEVVEPLYERQHSDLPNYITPEGLSRLKNRIQALENSIAARWIQLLSAILQSG